MSAESTRTQRSAESALAKMNAQVAAGYDFIKIYSEDYHAIVEHSRETGFPFGGHVPEGIAIEDAMRDGMLTIEYLTDWDPATTLAAANSIRCSPAAKPEPLRSSN